MKTPIFITPTYWFVLFCGLLAYKATAQDIQYTQFFNSPLYLNPAMTGATEQWRANLLHRSQWLAIDAQFISTTASVEYNSVPLRSGFGLLLSHDLAGKDRAVSMSAMGNYAFNFQLKKWTFRLGLQGGVLQRGNDYMNLVFPSQVLLNEPPISEAPLVMSRLVIDFSAGFLIHNDKFWVGFAANHLNQPVVGALSVGNAVLPMKFALHLGATLPMGSKSYQTYVLPTLLVKMQGAARQFDTGVRFTFDNSPLIFGAYYRGIPTPTYQDAVAGLIGMRFGDWKCMYSYDLTISGLTPTSGGSHEIGIVWEMATKAHKQFYGVNCPIWK
jgi:type IX secretion system PorP/SprF family membrane protein